MYALTFNCNGSHVMHSGFHRDIETLNPDVDLTERAFVDVFICNILEF